MNGAAPARGASGTAWVGRGLLAVAIVFLLENAKPLMLPVVIAIAFTFVLAAPVRWLRRRGLSEFVGAALVIASILAVIALLVSLLAAPAAQWWARAPETVHQILDSAHRLRSAAFPPPAAAPAAAARSAGAAASAAPAAADPIAEQRHLHQGTTVHDDHPSLARHHRERPDLAVIARRLHGDAGPGEAAAQAEAAELRVDDADLGVMRVPEVCRGECHVASQYVVLTSLKCRKASIPSRPPS